MTDTTTLDPERKRQHAPRRVQESPIRPWGYVGNYDTLAALAVEIRARIRSTLYGRCDGTMVACSPEGAVYLVAESHVHSERFVQDHPRWFVGRYAARPGDGSNAAVPSLDLLLEDLQCHIEQLDITTSGPAVVGSPG